MEFCYGQIEQVNLWDFVGGGINTYPQPDYDVYVYEWNDSTDRFDFERWSDWRQTKLSIIFQDIRLFHRLTAWENIQLKAQLYHPRPVSDQTLLEWMERLDILSLKDQPCETLSYGQRQRVGILRALCQPFDYILLDEPFSHLDQDNARIAADIIREVAENQGASRIMVSLGEDYGLPWDRVLQL